MVTSDSYSQSNMKVSCVQVSDTSKKQKAATNEYKIVVQCEDCKVKEQDSSFIEFKIAQDKND